MAQWQHISVTVQIRGAPQIEIVISLGRIGKSCIHYVAGLVTFLDFGLRWKEGARGQPIHRTPNNYGETAAEAGNAHQTVSRCEVPGLSHE